MQLSAERGRQTEAMALFRSCRGCEKLVSDSECVLACVLLVESSSNIAMQTAAPLDSCGDVRSVGPTSGTQRQDRTECNTEEKGGEWAGSRKNFIIHVNLHSSHLQHVSTSISEGHPSGKPSTLKVTFSSEGHHGTAPTISTSGVKGIFYT